MFSKERKLEDRKLTLLIVGVVVAILIVAFAIGYSAFSKRGYDVSESQTADGGQLAAGDAVEDSVKQYMQYYIQDSGDNAYISDEAAEEIVAQITTGVLNSLPETMQNDESTVKYIREMIAQSVSEEISKNNENVMSSEDYTITTTASKDMLYYIDNVVVPTLTAELQIGSGEVEDLKESLAATSTTYAQNTEKYDTIISNITKRLNSIESSSSSSSSTTSSKSYDSEIQSLLSDLKSLENVLTEYKSVSSKDFTSLDSEIASAQTLMQTYMAQLTAQTSDIKEYTQDEIDGIKALLYQKVAEMQNLSDSESDELLSIINNLEISNTADLSTLESQLRDAISSSSLEQSENLNTAVNSLTGMIDSLESSLTALTNSQLEELKASLLQQLAANKELSDEERKALEDAINALSVKNASDIESIQAALRKEITDSGIEMTDTMNSAVSSLNTTITELYYQISNISNTLQTSIDDLSALTSSQLDELKNSLLQQLAANKELSDEERKALEDAIKALSVKNASDIESIQEALRKEIEDSGVEMTDSMNSAVSSMTTTINQLYTEISNIQTSIDELSGLTEAQLNELKASLLKQIEDNASLSEEERAALRKSIDDLTTANAKDLASVKAALEKNIEETGITMSDNLNNAIESMNTTVDDIYSKIASLSSSVSSNTSTLNSHTSDINNLKSNNTNLQSQVTTNKNNIASLTTEMSSLKKSVSDGKALLANTITGLGVTTASDASWDTLNANIKKLATTQYNSGTTSAKVGTASAANVLSGKTFTNASGVGLTGTMANNATSTITLTIPEDTTKTMSFSSKIAKGFHTGSDTIKVDVSAVVAKAKNDAVSEVEDAMPDTLLIEAAANHDTFHVNGQDTPYYFYTKQFRDLGYTKFSISGGHYSSKVYKNSITGTEISWGTDSSGNVIKTSLSTANTIVLTAGDEVEGIQTFSIRVYK